MIDPPGVPWSPSAPLGLTSAEGRGRDQLRTAIAPMTVVRLSASLWAAGALAGLLGLLLPHGSGVEAWGWAAATALATGAAAWTWCWGLRLSDVTWDILSIAGVAVVGLVGMCAHHAGVLYVVATLFLLTAIHHASFLDGRPFVAALVFQHLLSAWLLLTSRLPAAGVAWIVLVVVSTTVACVVHVMRTALVRTAATDPLTGLPNRRSLAMMLARELVLADRHGHDLSLVVVDLDGFKAVNDQFGHHAGDDLLVGLAAAWRRQLRRSDLLARTGGDEFVLILPGADPGQACAALARLRDAGGQAFSAGVAGRRRDDEPTSILFRADQACYAAKAAGRDRVVLAHDAVPSRPA